MPATLPTPLRVAVYGSAAPPDPAWLDAVRREFAREPVVLAATTVRAALAELGADAIALLLRAGAELPAHCAERLSRALARTEFDVLSPLSNTEPALSPLPEAAEPTGADASSVDLACWLQGDRVVWPTAVASSACSLWRANAIAAFLASSASHESLPETISAGVLDHLYVGVAGVALRGPRPPADLRHAPPASPLAGFRARFAPIVARVPAYAGLDARPTLLHVLHGWGGGVEAFVRDLAETDRERVHLALVARGDTGRQRYGERIDLVLPGAGNASVLRFPLPRPIAATAITDEAWRAIAERVVAGYGVSHVVVSSLIGHSIDALRLGVPTTVVCHDYYPLWPVLHADFGDADARFDAEALRRALPRAEMPFAERDAAQWLALRDAYVDAIHESGARLVAPTDGVRTNIRRIEPRLHDVPFDVVAHGFRPFAAAAPRPPAPLAPEPARGSRDELAATSTSRANAPNRPRILVLGRITGGKGERLLAEVIPRITDVADVYLLGCGAAGERFFGVNGVHVELDYRRDELPQVIARIAPALALMPSTVAETYSYTLSELQALGVPVVATRLGSLAERIVDGDTGWLVDVDAAAVAERLRAVLGDEGTLAAMRARLRRLEHRTLESMLADHAAIWATTGVRAALGTVLAAPSIATLVAATEAERAIRAERALSQANATLAGQRRELAARADWASAQQRLADERTAWAKSLDADLRRAQDVVTQRQHEIDALVASNLELGDSLERTRQEREAVRDELQRQLHTFDLIVHSWSWQITKPLRFAMRTLRALKLRIGFRWRRLRELSQRGVNSLRVRGVGGTLAKVAQRFVRPPKSTLALSIPAQEAADAPETVTVPTSDTPRVSLVIPVYNQFAHTLTCLKSLAEHPGTIPFEAIVVDDCSSDETVDRLPRMQGIRAVRNAENLGFIGACNAGAALARGEFVVFLNNDTAVQPGWLEALIATFDNFPDCGLAGAKLVYPDARLQEAGGIVFSDGSGWNYGRFGDPNDAQFNYVREADYCSGAAIMVRRELFERFGGFDVRYRPAYYEDTDFAFRVREAGLKVYYQPASTVVHFEGISSGTDTSTGIKRYQVVNQEKFVDRWKDALPKQPKPGTPITLAREHRVRGRVLIVDAYVPEPDQDSGSVRLVNLMKLLVQMGYKVLFAPDNRAYVPRYTNDLQQLGVEVLYHPWYRDPIDWLHRNGAILDAAIVLRHYLVVSYAPLIRQYAPRARLIFDTVDLHYLREQRLADLNDDADLRRAAERTKLQELRMIRESDVTLVVSPVEKELLALEAPGARVEVLSNVHELGPTGKPFDERADLFFVGGFQHPPNVDAMEWFCRDVWPLIEAKLPGVKFHMIGSKMPPEISALATETIVAHGHVADLDPFLDGCRIAVAPLRYGAGVKGKVNQSMAHGQPVVATPMAVEGMFLEAGAEVLVGETPRAFADAVVALYHDRELWDRLAHAGRENVRRHFSFDAAKAAIARILPR